MPVDRSQSAFQPFKFPPVQDVVKLIEVDKPGQQFGRLVEFLLEAGIFSTEQVLLCPDDVLCIIGDMGLDQARILRSYAKCIVLPALGLHGNYEEPASELTMHQPIQPNIGESNQINQITHVVDSEALPVAEENLGEGSGTQWGVVSDFDDSEAADDYDSDNSSNADDKNFYYGSFSRGRSLSC
jgi:hypothetical protein